MTYQGTEHRYLVFATFHVDALDEGEAFAQVSNALDHAGMPPDGIDEITVGEGIVWVNVNDAEHQSETCEHLNHLIDHLVDVHKHLRDGLETADPADVHTLHRIEHHMLKASHANQGVHESIPDHDPNNLFFRGGSE